MDCHTQTFTWWKTLYDMTPEENDAYFAMILPGIVAGEERAWQWLTHTVHGLLLGWMVKKGIRLGDAEDAIQETLVCIWRAVKQDSYQSKGVFNAWVFSIARNRVIDWKRKNGHRITTVELEDLAWLQIEEAPPGNAQEAWEQNDWKRHAKEIFDQLTEEDKAILEMSLLGLMTSEQIAAKLGLPSAAAVRKRKGRLLEKLYLKMQPQLQ